MLEFRQLVLVFTSTILARILHQKMTKTIIIIIMHTCEPQAITAKATKQVELWHVPSRDQVTSNIVQEKCEIKWVKYNSWVRHAFNRTCSQK